MTNSLLGLYKKIVKRSDSAPFGVDTLLALHLDWKKYESKYKVGDTKQKNGKTYVFNENKRWTIAKQTTTEQKTSKSKASSKKSAVKEEYKDLTPESQAIIERLKRVMRGEEEAPDKPVVDLGKKEKTAKKATAKQAKTTEATTEKTKKTPSKTEKKPKEKQPEKSAPAEADKPANTGKKAKIKTQELEEIRNELSDKFGKELIDKAESNLQKVIDNSDVFVRVPGSKIVDQIITGGRFKSSFEAGKRGKDYNKRRGETESRMFGYDANTDPKDRPIYGYLGEKDFDDNSNSQQGPNQYGNVAIRLKSDVKKRASVTDNDTWQSSLPSDASKISAASLAGTSMKSTMFLYEDRAKQQLESAAKAENMSDYLKGARSPYMETHIHGGLQATDIGELIYTKGEKPSPKVLKWAKENGVVITVKD